MNYFQEQNKDYFFRHTKLKEFITNRPALEKGIPDHLNPTQKGIKEQIDAQVGRFLVIIQTS